MYLGRGPCYKWPDFNFRFFARSPKTSGKNAWLENRKYISRKHVSCTPPQTTQQGGGREGAMITCNAKRACACHLYSFPGGVKLCCTSFTWKKHERRKATLPCETPSLAVSCYISGQIFFKWFSVPKVPHTCSRSLKQLTAKKVAHGRRHHTWHRQGTGRVG